MRSLILSQCKQRMQQMHIKHLANICSNYFECTLHSYKDCWTGGLLRFYGVIKMRLLSRLK